VIGKTTMKKIKELPLDALKLADSSRSYGILRSRGFFQLRSK
jgi:hypothetical protein